MTWETVIGLEVHAQLSTSSKIFCGCSTTFGAPPNSQTCPVCLGLPGSLPVLNRAVVEFAVRLGLALGCEVRTHSVFARKNYFYPDVPKNYQISQFDRPICEGGGVRVELEDQVHTVPLERIHLEEDAGKSTHDHAGGRSLVDLNRTGVPLVEIVSRPALRSPAEAGAYLGSLRQLVRYLGICDGNMEQGSLRCDANISLRPLGQEELGTKVELKNMNSIRGVVQALTYEQARQAQVLEAGDPIHQETRTWDPDRNVSVFMRSKEFAHDYRYFPDPDLPPLDLDPTWIESIRASLPELPWARRERLETEHGIPAYDAQVLSESRELADYFEAVVGELKDGKAASNWMMSEVMRALNERGLEIGAFNVTPPQVAALLGLVAQGTISGKIAKDVFEVMVETGRDPAAIVQEKGLTQIDDADELGRIVEEILEKHPSQVEQFLGGKDGLQAFFVGQVMKATRGQANPQTANRVIQAALNARRNA